MKMSDLISENPTIYVLVGLPASGKSTWVNKKTQGSPYAFDIISSDDILERIAEEKGLTYSEVFQEHVGEATEQVWVDLKESIHKNKNIIFDQTNLKECKRAKILMHVPKNYVKIAVVHSIKLDELYSRLDARASTTGKAIPRLVIEKMSNEFQEPSIEEGFDLIIHEKQ